MLIIFRNGTSRRPGDQRAGEGKTREGFRTIDLFSISIRVPRTRLPGREMIIRRFPIAGGTARPSVQTEISEIRATRAFNEGALSEGYTRGRLHAASRRLCMRMLHVDISIAACL